MSEHPTHNISDSLFTCYGCGKAVGDLLAEECPTPDGVGLASWADVRAKAHTAIQREFGPQEMNDIARANLWDLEGCN